MLRLGWDSSIKTGQCAWIDDLMLKHLRGRAGGGIWSSSPGSQTPVWEPTSGNSVSLRVAANPGHRRRLFRCFPVALPSQCSDKQADNFFLQKCLAGISLLKEPPEASLEISALGMPN